MTAVHEPLKFCPQCATAAMTKQDFSSAVIDVCNVCMGVWLDDGELQQLVGEFGVRFRLDDEALQRARGFLERAGKAGDEVPAAETQRAQALHCPICQGVCFPTMYGFESGIIINRCGQGHGVFLDPTELEAILLYSARLLKGSDRVDSSLPPLASPGRASPQARQISAAPTQRQVRPPSGPHRKATEVLAPNLESENQPRSRPRLRTTRSLAQPQPIDVRVTVTRTGSLFFEAVRSPQGHWYPVRKGGTVLLADPGSPSPRYWVELENGGALVVRQAGLRFEWLLVGAGNPPDLDLTSTRRSRAQSFERDAGGPGTQGSGGFPRPS